MPTTNRSCFHWLRWQLLAYKTVLNWKLRRLGNCWGIWRWKNSGILALASKVEVEVEVYFFKLASLHHFPKIFPEWPFSNFLRFTFKLQYFLPELDFSENFLGAALPVLPILCSPGYTIHQGYPYTTYCSYMTCSQNVKIMTGSYSKITPFVEQTFKCHSCVQIPWQACLGCDKNVWQSLKC